MPAVTVPWIKPREPTCHLQYGQARKQGTSTLKTACTCSVRTQHSVLHEVNTGGKQQEPNDHSLTAVRGCSHTISSRCRTPVHGCGYLQPVLPPNVRTLQGVIEVSMQAWIILTRCKSREVTSHTSPGHVHHGFQDESVAAKCQGTLAQSLSFSQSLTHRSMRI